MNRTALNFAAVFQALFAVAALALIWVASTDLELLEEIDSRVRLLIYSELAFIALFSLLISIFSTFTHRHRITALLSLLQMITGALFILFQGGSLPLALPMLILALFSLASAANAHQTAASHRGSSAHPRPATLP